jgi:hypothetical protein
MFVGKSPQNASESVTAMAAGRARRERDSVGMRAPESEKVGYVSRTAALFVAAEKLKLRVFLEISNATAGAGRMRDQNPKGLWDQVVRRIKVWMDGDEDQASDPNLALHLIFIAPLLLGIIALVKR